jgi:hypothetical protein
MMIYLIGGAARSGKTIITQRLWREQHVPYFCIDYFMSAIDQGAPELGIQAESPNLQRAPVLWPRIEYLFRNYDVSDNFLAKVDTAYQQLVSNSS